MSVLVKSLKVSFLFLAGFPLFSSSVFARTLVQDGIKLPLVAADNQVDSRIQGKVLVDTVGEGAVLPEPPSAWEIIRSRSIWQNQNQPEEDIVPPAGLDNSLDDGRGFLNSGDVGLDKMGTFTNPSFSPSPSPFPSGAGLSKEEVLGLVDSTLGQFVSRPVTFSETLEVLGAVSLASTTVSGSFTQDGTLMLTEGRNIDVIGDTLRLQSEGLGAIDFIAGRMKLDREGDLVVSGRLSVAGGIGTDFLSPLASDTVTVGQNLAVEGVAVVGDLQSRGGITGRSLNVAEETSLAGPVTINNAPLTVKGSLSASDYARVGDLIIDRGLQILDQGESASIGTAMIYAGTQEVMIANTRVTADSKIFLTADFDPVGRVGLPGKPGLDEGQALFVSYKVPGSRFVVSTDQLLEEDLTFNWLLVN